MLHLRHLRRPTPFLTSTRPFPHPQLRFTSSSPSSPSSPLPSPTPPSTVADEEEPHRKSFYLYYNLLFPLRTSLFDLRYLLTRFQRPQLLESLEKQLEPIDKRYEGVKVEEIKTREKDGGAFVRISWDQLRAEENDLSEQKVMKAVEEEAVRYKYIPSGVRGRVEEITDTDMRR